MSDLKPPSEWKSASAHVGVVVPDMDAARAFYVGILGFEEAWEHKTGATVLEAATGELADGKVLDELMGIPDVWVHTVQLIVPWGGSRIELQEFRPQGETGGATYHRQGLAHLSFPVEDVQAEYERLRDAGVKFAREPASISFGTDIEIDGWAMAIFHDPWGTPLELMGPAVVASSSGGEVATA